MRFNPMTAYEWELPAFLKFAAPKARAKLASRPSHAAWDAVREAEALNNGRRIDGGDRFDRFVHPVYRPEAIERLRLLAKVLARYI